MTSTPWDAALAVAVSGAMTGMMMMTITFARSGNTLVIPLVTAAYGTQPTQETAMAPGTTTTSKPLTAAIAVEDTGTKPTTCTTPTTTTTMIEHSSSHPNTTFKSSQKISL